MLGWVVGQDERKGVTAFTYAYEPYTNYISYTGSIVEDYVNAYKTKLKGFGAKIKSASLITVKELENLGCTRNNYSIDGNNSCKYSNKPWLYSTSYWTGTADQPPYVWFVRAAGGYYYISDCNVRYNFGVRPVITIATSDIS